MKGSCQWGVRDFVSREARWKERMQNLGVKCRRRKQPACRSSLSSCHWGVQSIELFVQVAWKPPSAVAFGRRAILLRSGSRRKGPSRLNQQLDISAHPPSARATLSFFVLATMSTPLSPVHRKSSLSQELKPEIVADDERASSSSSAILEESSGSLTVRTSSHPIQLSSFAINSRGPELTRSCCSFDARFP